MTKTRTLLAAALASLVPVVLAGFAFAGSPRSETTVASRSTAAFHDLDKAIAAGYSVRVQDAAGIECIAQSGEGAMGIHMLNPELLDGTIDGAAPELLVYEPRPNGKLKLVALEYLVFQAAWGPSPPSLFGRTFDFAPAGNRYGLPPFYSLHAWIWKPNPSGLLQPWNPNVNCP